MQFSPIKNDILLAHLLIIAAVLFQKTVAINVQTGDTLARIAAEQGVSVAALEAANPGISANDLQPGQVLSVPAPSSVSKSSSSSMTTSTTSTSSSHKPTTSTSSTKTPPPPPPPPPTPAPKPSPAVVTADLTSVAKPSCAPSPIGKYHDADAIISNTHPFCSNNGDLTLAELLAAPYDGLLSGDNQEGNSDDGNGGLASNEGGFNMTISAVPNCVYPKSSTQNFTVGWPMGTASTSKWDCSAVLTNCWKECE